MLRKAVVAAAMLAASSCEVIKSCDHPGSMGPNAVCVDVHGANYQASWGAICPSEGGTFADHPCDLTNIVAGCRDPNIAEVVTWWYASDTIRTPLDVSTQCTKRDELFVQK